jgi:hypothetical protein
MMALIVSKFSSLQLLLTNPKVTAVLRVCSLQATLAITFVCLLAITTNFWAKILCSMTIVYMQVWLLLRATAQPAGKGT